MPSSTEHRGESKDASKEGSECSPEALSDMIKNGCKDPFPLDVMQALGGSVGVAKALGTSLKKGYSSDASDIDRRRKEYGQNYVELPPLKSYLALCIEGTDDFTIQLLFVAAVVSLVIGLLVEQNFDTGWFEGAAISVSIAIVLNVGAMTEYKKERSFREQQIEMQNTETLTVIRGGEDVDVNPKHIVVGDLVRIKGGNTIPADGFVVDSADLKVDESSLTGEPKLIPKHPSAKSGKEFFLLSGTQVQIGSGKMLVCAVGTRSFQGRIEESLTQEDVKDEMDLASRLDGLANDIGKAGGVVALVCFVAMSITWGIDLSSGICKDSAFKDYVNGAECNAKKGCGWNLSEDVAKQAAQASFDVGNITRQAYDTAMGGTHDQCKREWDEDVDLNKILGFFITAVTILVVAIPEGLPLAVVLSLAIAQRKMLQENNMVRKLEACETMGSATTVCSDKTGTLTKNEMTVTRAYFGKQQFAAEIGSHTVGEKMMASSEIQQKVVELVKKAICVNCAPTSKVTRQAAGSGSDWKYSGNATECALLKLALNLGADYKLRTTEHKPVDGCGLDWGVKAFPFSSQRKRMSWVVRSPSGGYRLFCKGAPKPLFAITKDVLLGDGRSTEQLTSAGLADLSTIVRTYEDNAMRTLALGFRDFPDVPSGGWDKKDGDGEAATVLVEKGLTLIGVVGIEDPLRADVPEAIRQCHSAGVDVRMCTGDSLATAVAIAKGCNILSDKDLSAPDSNGVRHPKPNFAMTGAEFDERVHLLDTAKPKVRRRCFDVATNTYTDCMAFPFVLDDKGKKVIDHSVFDEIWPKLRVLARCQPEDKLTLVKGLRESLVFQNKEKMKALKDEYDIDIFPDHQVVAVTGDGTNDAPALKAANVGFAMGLTGTQVARTACDIVILDDNFKTIVKAMLWGRNVFDSISKFIQFQLTVNIVALTTAVLGAFLYNASPLGAVQMLWVNLIMDSLASIALATEPPVDQLLERKPYGKRRPLITRVMWFNMIGQSIYQILVVALILFKGHTFIESNKCYQLSKHGDAVDPLPCVGDDTYSPYYNKDYPYLVQYPPGGGIVSDHGTPSEHWSVIFNAFVMLQVFNEFNSRKLQTIPALKSDWREWVCLFGVLNNPVFLAIVGTTFVLQIGIMQFFYHMFTVLPLSLNQWIVCIVLGSGSLVVQVFINLALVVTSRWFPEADTILMKPLPSAKVAPMDAETKQARQVELN